MAARLGGAGSESGGAGGACGADARSSKRGDGARGDGERRRGRRGEQEAAEEREAQGEEAAVGSGIARNTLLSKLGFLVKDTKSCRYLVHNDAIEMIVESTMWTVRSKPHQRRLLFHA